jgi:hypothetical protein
VFELIWLKMANIVKRDADDRLFLVAVGDVVEFE